jgi:hypothetical protein
MPLGSLNLVMGSSMGRETDGAGNHVSGCPAQNASNTGKKEPGHSLPPLKNSRCPLFLSTCIRALSAASAAKFIIAPVRWQHPSHVAIVRPESKGKREGNDWDTACRNFKTSISLIY